MINEDRNRELFELWVSNEPHKRSTTRDEDGKYKARSVQEMWEAWFAATNAIPVNNIPP